MLFAFNLWTCFCLSFLLFSFILRPSILKVLRTTISQTNSNKYNSWVPFGIVLKSSLMFFRDWVWNTVWMVFSKIFNDFDPKTGTRFCVFWHPFFIISSTLFHKSVFESSLARSGSPFGSFLIALGTFWVLLGHCTLTFGTRICRKQRQTAADTSRGICASFRRHGAEYLLD